MLEIVISIIVLAVASILIIMLQSTLSVIQLTARNSQSMIEARQECAEEILMIREKLGYEGISSASDLLDPDKSPLTPPPYCEALWNLMGKNISATIFVSEEFNFENKNSKPGVSGAFCPTVGYVCKEVYIPASGADRTFLPFNDSGVTK